MIANKFQFYRKRLPFRPTRMEMFPAITQHLRRSFRSGKTRPIAYRKNQLQQLRKLIQDNEQQLCDALHKDLRRCKVEALVFEITITINEIDTALKEIDHWAKPRKVQRTLLQLTDNAYIKRDPLGLVLIISPWNYPVNLSLMPLVGAIAGGNCAILKPSELSVATSQLLAQLIPEYLDEDCYRVVTGGVAETTELLKERFDHIFYTGSTAVGSVILQAASKYLTPVTLELGGKSPAIVDEDSDLELAGKRIAWGKFMNAGQTCISPDYVLCTESVKPKLVASIQKYIRDAYGDDVSKSPEYSRIINQRHFDRLSNVLNQSGGSKAFGGKTVREDLYIEPTILVDVKPTDSSMADELFGPILPVVTVKNLDEAIDFVNDREKPLALYIFSRSNRVLKRCIEETSSGGVTANDCIMHISLDTLPFGGVGKSGMGRYHGRFSFDTFTHEKACLERPQSGEGLLWMRYPPFTDGKVSALKMLGTNRRLPNVWKILSYLMPLLVGFLLGFLIQRYAVQN